MFQKIMEFLFGYWFLFVFIIYWLLQSIASTFKNFKQRRNQINQNYLYQQKLELEKQYKQRLEQERIALEENFHHKYSYLQAELQQTQEQLQEKLQQTLSFKKLHYLLLQNSFIFEKTAIDDTLINKTRYQLMKESQISMISPISISVQMEEWNKTYTTTLNSCTCDDFQTHHIPCKHMLYFALSLGLLTDTRNPTEELKRMESLLYPHYVEQYETLYHKCQQKEKEVHRLINEKSIQYPWLAKMFAEYVSLRDKMRLQELSTRGFSHEKSYDIVNTCKKEKHLLAQQYKKLEYELYCYTTFFPWISQYEASSPMQIHNMMRKIPAERLANYEPYHRYLSPEEYVNLSEHQKAEVIHKHYEERKKTNWELGLELERYVGYLYELKGYNVTYTGALMGERDMGRDLVVSNKDDIQIIQCKRWSKQSIIHENVVFQLYGTVTLYQKENPKQTVQGILITTTTLSQQAKHSAESLNITVCENFAMSNYPKIKC